MSQIVKSKKPAKPPLSNLQKTFNRLKKRVEILQKELQKTQQGLDQALLFYYEKIEPENNALILALTQFVKSLYAYYRGAYHLSKKERHILKEFILDKTNEIFDTLPFDEVDSEIRVIFKEMSGVSYEKIASNELNSLKQGIQEMFKEEGIAIDLSKIELNDSEEEITHKLYEAINEARGEGEKPPAKPKSKKELQKEAKARELEELQKKGLNTIYKQLAKAFHPDLEQDSEQKAEKEQLMKRLTNAYENHDLHTLLSLEMEWMNRSNSGKKIQGDDQLKIYNSILKDQIATLEENIEMASLHPKYLPLQCYIVEIKFMGRFFLETFHKNLKVHSQKLRNFIKKLQGAEAESFIQTIIQQYPK